MNTLTTILALLIIDKVGRKKLIYYGVSGMVVSLILIGQLFPLRKCLEYFQPVSVSLLSVLCFLLRHFHLRCDIRTSL